MKGTYLILLLCLVVFATTVMAQEGGEAEIESYVNKLVDTAQWFVGIAGVLVVIISGVMWMTSGGDENKVERAKKVLIYGVIGVAVVLLAEPIQRLLIPNI